MIFGLPASADAVIPRYVTHKCMLMIVFIEHFDKGLLILESIRYIHRNEIHVNMFE